MKGNSVSFLSCLAVAALALASCGGKQSEEGTSDRSGLNLSAEIDPAASRVVLPSDRFMLSDFERSLLNSAVDVSIDVCARKKLGFRTDVYAATPEKEKIRGMWYGLGPWTKEMAGTYGFVKPAPKSTLIANGFIPDDRSEEAKKKSERGIDGHLSEEDRKKVRDVCRDNPDRIPFDNDDLDHYFGPGWQKLLATRSSLLEDPEVVKVRQELAVCYEEMGLTLGDNTEEGVNVDPKQANFYRIDEEQIGLALKAVECKSKVNAIPRVVNVWASLQAPIIEEYADEFIAQRNKIDEALSKAKKYIAEHPEAFQGH